MDEEARTEVEENTRESEDRSAHRGHVADREPDADEERIAEETADELEGDGTLEGAAEHERKTNRLGAEVKGEGTIP